MPKRRNKKGDFRGMMGTLPDDIRGKLNGNWKGGLHFRKDGYILVRIGVISRKHKGKRYDLLHRIIMANYLGRPLLKKEIVHHKNGVVTDNRVENLEIMLQSNHAKTHPHERNKKTGRFK